MAKIFKLYFKNIGAIHNVLREIGMFEGLFLIRNAYGRGNGIDTSKAKLVFLSDHSQLAFMDNIYFHDINSHGELGFDWTEIYFFEGQFFDKNLDIYLNTEDKVLEKINLLYYFKKRCDFWAASIDGDNLWLMSSNNLLIQNLFLSLSNKFEEQRDLSFFKMVCNDLLFYT